jgi:tryptophan-rich sensory protein
MKLAPSILVCLAAGIIGSAFTMPAIAGWYATLAKPAFSPPNWLFGPAWTVLYILMGASLYLVWSKNSTLKEAKWKSIAIKAFAIQLILNVAWSVLFFGLQSAVLGFAGIVALWISIAATMRLFRKIDRKAFWLLVPYILWVSFAAVLNFSIWVLNPL